MVQGPSIFVAALSWKVQDAQKGKVRRMAEGLLMRDDREAETSPWSYDDEPSHRTVNDPTLIFYRSPVDMRQPVCFFF